MENLCSSGHPVYLCFRLYSGHFWERMDRMRFIDFDFYFIDFSSKERISSMRCFSAADSKLPAILSELANAA